MARRPWSRSLRLVFEVSGGEIRLVSRQPVNMMPPPPAAAPEPQQSGAWAELRTTEEQPVYHQLLAHLSAPGAEVFSPDPKQSVRRVDTAAPQTFVVVVPDTEDARSLVIMGPPRAGARAEEAVAGRTSEIARFDLAPDKGRQP